MAIDFASLKKNRKQNFQKLTDAVSNMDGGGFKQDERIWKPKYNKETKRGNCVVRLMPAHAEEEKAIQQVFSYSFNGPGGYYGEKSLTTIGKEDPVSQENKRLWNTGLESDKNIVKGRKRNVKYYCNAYIIKDDVYPENEGKVFIFEFGPMIYNYIKKHIDSKGIKEDYLTEEELETGTVRQFDPFDLWDGADFRITVTTKMIDTGKGQVEVPNYRCRMLEQNEFFEGNDEKKEEIWKQVHKLGEFVDPANFKSFEDLVARFEKVTGKKIGGVAAAMQAQPAPEEAAPVQQAVEEPKAMPTADSSTSTTDDDDELLRMLDEM